MKYKHLYTTDPAEMFLERIIEGGGGNNQLTTYIVRPASRLDPIVFEIRGEWERESFEQLILRLKD